MQREFLGGVVEGFYGRPWTADQRLELLESMPGWGLNTYFYAPKDDLHHRALWREVYPPADLATIQHLIDASRQQGIRFVYGLSPGLDIQFSNAAERQRIVERFAQLIDAGCHDFGLLFDDLPGQISDLDRREYRSVAEAQAGIANDVLHWLRSRVAEGRFLFCPTPYCDRMDRWNLGGEDYLDRLGASLATDIDILWTGPEIVSREIPVASLSQLHQRLRRTPVIWDNLHANDYDGRRLFVGPYAGRPPEMKQHVAGILANPNNEFAVNFVPLRTLGEYLQCDRAWDSRAAYLAAIAEWHAKYATIGEPIELDDLVLLGDCFYLPFEDGAEAERMIRMIELLIHQPCDTWGNAETQFNHWNRRVQELFDRLTQLKDRELFYAWCRRAWDLKEELQLVRGFLDQKLKGISLPKVETHLPGTCRGGAIARLQRLLEMDEEGRFCAAERK